MADKLPTSAASLRSADDHSCDKCLAIGMASPWEPIIQSFESPGLIPPMLHQPACAVLTELHT